MLLHLSNRRAQVRPLQLRGHDDKTLEVLPPDLVLGRQLRNRGQRAQRRRAAALAVKTVFSIVESDWRIASPS